MNNKNPLIGLPVIKTHILVTSQQMTGPFVVMVLIHGKRNVFFSDSSEMMEDRRISHGNYCEITE
jgi:hypothetical protein